MRTNSRLSVVRVASHAISLQLPLWHCQAPAQEAHSAYGDYKGVQLGRGCPPSGSRRPPGVAFHSHRRTNGVKKSLLRGGRQSTRAAALDTGLLVPGGTNNH